MYLINQKNAIKRTVIICDAWRLEMQLVIAIGVEFLVKHRVFDVEKYYLHTSTRSLANSTKRNFDHKLWFKQLLYLDAHSYT